jgi:hypothetical protein
LVLRRPSRFRRRSGTPSRSMLSMCCCSNRVSTDQRILDTGFIQKASQLLNIVPCGGTRVVSHVPSASQASRRASTAHGRGSFLRDSGRKKGLSARESGTGRWPSSPPEPQALAACPEGELGGDPQLAGWVAGLPGQTNRCHRWGGTWPADSPRMCPESSLIPSRTSASSLSPGLK